MSRINASATRRSCRSVTGILSFTKATCDVTDMSQVCVEPPTSSKCFSTKCRGLHTNNESQIPNAKTLLMGTLSRQHVQKLLPLPMVLPM